MALKYWWLVLLWIIVGCALARNSIMDYTVMERLPMFVVGLLLHIITGIIGFKESERIEA